MKNYLFKFLLQSKITLNNNQGMLLIEESNETWLSDLDKVDMLESFEVLRWPRSVSKIFPKLYAKWRHAIKPSIWTTSINAYQGSAWDPMGQQKSYHGIKISSTVPWDGTINF